MMNVFMYTPEAVQYHADCMKTAIIAINSSNVTLVNYDAHANNYLYT